MATLEDGRLIAVPLTCRAWDCPRCAKTQKRKLLRRLKAADPKLFITLTTSERTASNPIDAYFRASQGFSALIKRWRRKFPGEPVEYFLVWEKTKRGWPHAHVLLRAPKVSKHWLSHTWKELTGSYVVDLQAVSGHARAAEYLAKYLAKDPAVPKGQRRYRRSAGFWIRSAEEPVNPLPIVGKWTREPYDLPGQAAIWLRKGLAVQFDAAGHLIASNNPEAHAAQVMSGLYERLIRQSQSLLYSQSP